MRQPFCTGVNEKVRMLLVDGTAYAKTQLILENRIAKKSPQQLRESFVMARRAKCLRSI
jgi:hypothetical protein